MKILLLSLFVILGFTACAVKDTHYYDRANAASENSLNGLDKDTSK